MKDTFDIYNWNKKRHLAEAKLQEAAPVELPVIPDSILNKFANQIKTPQSFSSAIIALINKLAEKENPNILKNPKLVMVLDKLSQLAQEEPKGEVKETMYIDDEEFEAEMGRTPEDTENEIDKEMERMQFSYLNDLRDSGVTNMFGAGPYLEQEFSLGKREARTILGKWMRTFSESVHEDLDENLKGKAKEALRKVSTVAKEKGQDVKSFLKNADGMEIMSALFPGLTAASQFMEEKNDKI